MREPNIRAFEVADGVLRLRESHKAAFPLADLALDAAAGEVDILGVNLRPASSGVGDKTLKRFAVSASVQRAIARTRLGVKENSGHQSPDLAALQAIRGVLGQLDRAAPEGLSGVLYSRNLGEALASGLNNARDVKLAGGYVLGDLFQGEGRVGWWHKSVGTPHNLAQKSPPFKRVYDSIQNFLSDVNFYAAEAAKLAPNILPTLDNIGDVFKSPLSAADTKALSGPVFEGTLAWGRDKEGKAQRIADGEANTAKPGVVFILDELKLHFKMTDAQALRTPFAHSGLPNRRFKMKLPTKPEERKQLAKTVVLLMKLPPAKRKAVLHNEMRKRGLTPNEKKPSPTP